MIEELVWLGCAVFCAISTYWIQIRFSIYPVLASALVTLFVAIAVLPFDALDWVRTIPYAGIGGTFIGMSSRKNVKGYESVLLAAIIFGLIFIHSSKFFEGYGGALGTSACISVLTSISWGKFLKRTHYTAKKVANRTVK